MENRVRVLLSAHPQYAHIKPRIDDWLKAVMEIDPARAEFHAVRVGGFGGSEIGALAANADDARDDFSSARDIVKSKLLLATPLPSTGHLERGVDLEPVARSKFHRKFLHLNGRTDMDAMLALTKATGRRGWERYSPDDIVLMDVNGKARRILVDYKAPVEDFEGADEVQARYSAQLHLGRYLCKQVGIPIDGMVLAPLSYGLWDTVDFSVPYDAVMEKRILEAGDYYWNDFVLKGELPPYISRPKFLIEDEEKLAEALRLSHHMSSYKLMSDVAAERTKDAQTRLKDLLSGFAIGKSSLSLGLLSISSSPRFDTEAVVKEIGAEKAAPAVIAGDYDTKALVSKVKELAPDLDMDTLRIANGYDEVKLREVLAALDIDPQRFESDTYRMTFVRTGDAILELKADASRMVGDGFEAMSKRIESKGLTADVKPGDVAKPKQQSRQRAA